MRTTSPLSHLPMGRRATLNKVGGEGSFRRRLMEMGLTPGVEVRLLKRAPMGDPLEIEVRGARLSIRRKDAKALEVEPLPTRSAPSLRAALSPDFSQ